MSSKLKNAIGKTFLLYLPLLLLFISMKHWSMRQDSEFIHLYQLVHYTIELDKNQYIFGIKKFSLQKMKI